MISNIKYENYPSKILGLDISTSCIGASIIYTDGETIEIQKITHINPRITNTDDDIEALFKRKEIFENEFLVKLKDENITECVIEAPILLALGNSNPHTVTQLIKMNILISEAVYYKLGIMPYYISSLDSRVYAFPELLGVRKYKRNGKLYDIETVTKNIEKNHTVAFADYPFDCDKKNIMMNLICDKFPEINWTYNKNGDFKKENFDACDSLVCALAYANIKRYGEMNPIITDVHVTTKENKKKIIYKINVWDKIIDKEMML